MSSSAATRTCEWHCVHSIQLSRHRSKRWPPSQLAPDFPKPAGVSTESLEQPKKMATAFVQAVERFDALVSALPDIHGVEEAQAKRIAELQASNEAFGQELQRELEAAEYELQQIQELYDMGTDNWLHMKPP